MSTSEFILQIKINAIWKGLHADRKFRNFWGSAKALRRLSDTICIENGYSIVENPRRRGLSYNKWLGENRKPCHRELICADIDQALSQNPESFEELLRLLEEVGYQIKRGNVPSLHGRNSLINPDNIFIQ